MVGLDETESFSDERQDSLSSDEADYYEDESYTEE